jgi:peptidoglycan-associated lipoprotein
LLAGTAATAQRQPPAPPPPPSPAALQADLNLRAGSDTVYFSAQGYGLTPQAIAGVRAMATWLIANPFATVRLEGHADQFDPRDHAIALGERRAAAVRDFLIAQGIAPNRMTVTSWGKERPGSMRIGANVVGVGPRVVMVVR